MATHGKMSRGSRGEGATLADLAYRMTAYRTLCCGAKFHYLGSHFGAWDSNGKRSR